jgi:hypothetical protein
MEEKQPTQVGGLENVLQCNIRKSTLGMRLCNIWNVIQNEIQSLGCLQPKTV